MPKRSWKTCERRFAEPNPHSEAICASGAVVCASFRFARARRVSRIVSWMEPSRHLAGFRNLKAEASFAQRRPACRRGRGDECVRAERASCEKVPRAFAHDGDVVVVYEEVVPRAVRCFASRIVGEDETIPFAKDKCR